MKIRGAAVRLHGVKGMVGGMKGGNVGRVQRDRWPTWREIQWGYKNIENQKFDLSRAEA